MYYPSSENKGADHREADEALPGVLGIQGEGLFIFRDLGRRVIYFQGFLGAGSRRLRKNILGSWGERSFFFQGAGSKDPPGGASLICVFVFAYADCWFSHEAAHLDILRSYQVQPCQAHNQVPSILQHVQRLGDFFIHYSLYESETLEFGLHTNLVS